MPIPRGAVYHCGLCRVRRGYSRFSGYELHGVDNRSDKMVRREDAAAAAGAS